MEKSSFFNSVDGDRKYNAESLANYFASFIGNGIFPTPSTNLQVLSSNDMAIKLSPGKAWINGYYYQNDSDLMLNLDLADGILNRIDRVTVRLDYLNREIKAYVKKGTAASNPVAPNLQRDSDAFELGIAEIKVNKGTVKITQSEIKDLRMDANLCGIVTGVVSQIDTTNLFAQYQTSFELWFEAAKGQLSEDAAGNLYNLITKQVTSPDGATIGLKVYDGKMQYKIGESWHEIAANDIQARDEIVRMQLALEQAKIFDFLNKTGIGFYDTFRSLENIASTTASVNTSIGEVNFALTKQTLLMRTQTFPHVSSVLLALYDDPGERIYMKPKTSITGATELEVMAPEEVKIGDKYCYNGVIYTVTASKSLT